jgi:hypothetical protein
VSDAGVIWLRGEDRFQQRCALKLVGVGLVSGGSRNVECDRVRDLSFVIVGIARRYLLFRCEIFLDARAMIYFVIVDLHRGDRVDVVPLALCLSSERTKTNADTAWRGRTALGPEVCKMWQSALCPVVLQQIVRQQLARRSQRLGQRPLRVISVSWNPLRAADEVQRHNIMLSPQSEATQYHPFQTAIFKLGQTRSINTAGRRRCAFDSRPKRRPDQCPFRVSVLIARCQRCRSGP